MSDRFPINPHPKSWSPLGSPPARIPAVFPWTRRSTAEVAGMLVLVAIAVIVAITVPDPADNIVGIAIAAALFGAWVAWLVLDIRTLRKALATLPRFEPQQRPRLHLPMRHLMVPTYLAWLVLAAALGQSGVLFGLVFALVFWVAGQISGYAIAYVLLPRDSIEAALQRDAAAISFLILTAVLSTSFIAAPLVPGIHFSLNNPSNKFALTELLALAPIVLPLGIYGATYCVLKRRVG